MSEKTTVVHCKKRRYDVYIGRPSKWGNPFSHKKGTKAEYRVENLQESLDSYREYILKSPLLLKDLHELEGKVLGCWCKPSPCHGDILVELIESERDYYQGSIEQRARELGDIDSRKLFRKGEL